MSLLEEYAISELKSFVEEASEKGICFNGCDISRDLQVLVIQIIEEYIEEHEG